MATRQVKHTPLYVGTMNDGLFIIDQPPRPAPKDEDTGTLHKVNVIATMANNDREASRLANVFAASPDLLEALKEIAGGHTPGLSDLVLAGDWRGVAVKFQEVAKAAASKAELQP